MKAKIKAVSTHRCRVTAERIYDAWLDPDKVRRWMAAALQGMGLTGDMRRVEIDPTVGGRFHFSDVRGGVETDHWGNYLELERPHRIVFTWITDPADEDDPSVVTLTFISEPEGCTARIVHAIDAKWAEYVSRVESSWGRMLEGAEQEAE